MIIYTPIMRLLIDFDLGEFLEFALLELTSLVEPVEVPGVENSEQDRDTRVRDGDPDHILIETSLNHELVSALDSENDKLDDGRIEELRDSEFFCNGAQVVRVGNMS